MNDWRDESPAGRRPGAAAGVRFERPWASAEQAVSTKPRLLSFIPTRVRNLLIAGLAPVVVLTYLWAGGSPPAHNAEHAAAPASFSPAPAPAATNDPNRRTYAVALPALRGLPEDAPPGTRLDLWVTWNDRVKTDERLQHLLDDVRLERVAPPVTPESVPAAILSVPKAAVADLLYGDLFGNFAVTMRD
ncbi:MAG TPA: hypothetical protein VM784_08560 [Actinomycetota bacterium]|nr:hypothetical protein [Actinomycetota bacterium]